MPIVWQPYRLILPVSPPGAITGGHPQIRPAQDGSLSLEGQKREVVEERQMIYAFIPSLNKLCAHRPGPGPEKVRAYWPYIGPILALYWLYIGPILALYWPYIGLVLAKPPAPAGNRRIRRRRAGNRRDTAWPRPAAPGPEGPEKGGRRRETVPSGPGRKHPACASAPPAHRWRSRVRPHPPGRRLAGADARRRTESGGGECGGECQAEGRPHRSRPEAGAIRILPRPGHLVEGPPRPPPI